jgi:metal-responsive CopG/Arc/MetJ family transcriptional regulator
MSERIRVTVDIEPSLRDTLDEIAKFVCISRSSLIRRILYNAIRGDSK